MCTKKDHLALSTILRNTRPDAGRNTRVFKTWWRIREDIIAYLYSENYRFDRELFREHTEFNKDWMEHNKQP